MTAVYIVLGIVLTVLFFLNVKSAADILCRTIGGIIILLMYNTVFPALPGVGVNLVCGVSSGLLGLPGVLLVICLSVFL